MKSKKRKFRISAEEEATSIFVIKNSSLTLTIVHGETVSLSNIITFAFRTQGQIKRACSLKTQTQMNNHMQVPSGHKKQIVFG